jgi:hypothetical protein
MGESSAQRCGSSVEYKGGLHQSLVPPPDERRSYN